MVPTLMLKIAQSWVPDAFGFPYLSR